MTEAEKLVLIAENEKRVKEAGKQEEYDRFWDALQNNGERVSYRYAFMYAGWDDTNFKPKYDMMLSNGTYMFANSNIEDLVAILQRQNVVLDTSSAVNVSAMFQLCAKLKRVPKIDLSSATGTNVVQLFNSCQNLEEIEEVVFHSGITSTVSCFSFLPKLTKLKISGEIVCTIDIQTAPLDKASITSVINALSANVTGQKAIFKKSAKEAAFTADEWATLIATKSNWTFSLV